MVVGEFTRETDLLVLGGGPGGYTAAFKAAQRGIATTIVESTPFLGGVCLHRGCIPSKTLLGIAELLTLPDHARAMGVDFAKATFDLDKVNDWKSKVITKLARGLGAVAKKLKVEVIQGTATFEDARHVALADGDVRRIRFKRCVIAAGSRPVRLRGIEADSPRVVDSTGALRMEAVPKTRWSSAGATSVWNWAACWRRWAATSPWWRCCRRCCRVATRTLPARWSSG
jgi:dihydrolipoamide dehydrogenase